MLSISKTYVVDENNSPIAVQIPIKDYKAIEEVLENYGLSKLIEEVHNDETLSFKEAKRSLNL